MNPNDAEGLCPDPMIDDVRKVRRELAEQFGNDVVKLCDYLRRVEAEHASRIVQPLPEKAER